MNCSEALPVVYLPGASGNGAVWSPIAGRLAKRRPPILVDYPGSGRHAVHHASALAETPSSLEVRSFAGLCRFVASALPERCDVAALSMGGVVALALALEHPERIRKLVLVTTAGGVDMKSFGAIDWRESFRANRPNAPTWFLDDDTDFSSRLGGIMAPTLLIFGDKDPIAPSLVGEFLAARLPAARLEIIAGATHDLDAEHPDLLASLMEAHFRR